MKEYPMNRDPNTTNHVSAGFEPVPPSRRGLCDSDDRIPITTPDGSILCVGHHYTSASNTMVAGRQVGQAYTGPVNFQGCTDSTCSSMPLPRPGGPSRGFPL
jgi:hypothetical protein